MLNVEFLNAEIVSLLGNLLYSRVIYLKKLVGCYAEGNV